MFYLPYIGYPKEKFISLWFMYQFVAIELLYVHIIHIFMAVNQVSIFNIFNPELKLYSLSKE
jgi:hypothetical protein